MSLWPRRDPAGQEPPESRPRLGASVLKGVIEALIIAIVLTFASPIIVREAARVDPSCNDHPGLVPVNLAVRLRDNQATATSMPPVEDQFAAARAFDTRTGSGWAAPVARPGRTTVEESLNLAVQSAENPLAALRLEIKDPIDVRLVCVVNGTPRDPASYRRADRIQRADVAMSCWEEPVTTVLRTMPDDRIHEAQQLGGHCDGATYLELRVRQAYPGENITDPATGRREPPTGLVAVAEITLYRPARPGEQDYSRLSSLLDLFRGPFA